MNHRLCMKVFYLEDRFAGLHSVSYKVLIPRSKIRNYFKVHSVIASSYEPAF